MGCILNESECDVDAETDHEDVLLAELLIEQDELALMDCVTLVLDELLNENDQDGVPDIVAVSDAEIVDDSETLRDIDPVSSLDMVSDLLRDSVSDMEFVFVGVALDVNDKLNDDEDVTVCDSMRVTVVERLALALMLSVVLVVYEVVPLLLDEEVLVTDAVDEDVNVVLLEPLGEKLAVLLAVAVELVVKLWLVDGDAVIERVPEDVTDALVDIDLLLD